MLRLGKVVAGGMLGAPINWCAVLTSARRAGKWRESEFIRIAREVAVMEMREERRRAMASLARALSEVAAAKAPRRRKRDNVVKIGRRGKEKFSAMHG